MTGSLPPPNYTQIPNAILDNMAELSEVELRVMLAACRQTFGWHRERATMSNSFLVKATGLSDQGVRNGVAQATDRQWLVKAGEGARGVSIYSLDLSDPPTQLGSDPVTPQPGWVEPPNSVDPNKESPLKKKDSAQEREGFDGGDFTDRQAAIVARCVVDGHYRALPTGQWQIDYRREIEQLLSDGLIRKPRKNSNQYVLTDFGSSCVEMHSDSFQVAIDTVASLNSKHDATMKKNRAAEKEKKSKSKPTTSKNARENPDIEPYRAAITSALNWNRDQVKNWDRIDKICYRMKKESITPESIIEWGVWNSQLRFGQTRNPENIFNVWADFMRDRENAPPPEAPYVEPTIDIGKEYL